MENSIAKSILGSTSRGSERLMKDKIKVILDSAMEQIIKSAKKMGQIGKYGITGNTGLGIGGNFHVSMPYDSNGKVFVKCEINDGSGATFDSWKRVNPDKADQKKIIRCYFCDKPAVRLDHLHPYHDETTACKDHLDEFKKHLNKKEFPERKYKYEKI